MLERLRAEHPDVRYAHGFVIQQLVEGPRAGRRDRREPRRDVAGRLEGGARARGPWLRRPLGAIPRTRASGVSLTDRGRAVVDGRSRLGAAINPSWPRRWAPSASKPPRTTLKDALERARGDARGAGAARTAEPWGEDPGRSRPRRADPMTRRYGFRSRSRAALPHRGRGLRPPPEGPLLSAHPPARPARADRRHRAPVPRGHAQRAAADAHRPREGRRVRGRERGRLLVLGRGPRALPRQRLLPARLDLDRHARDPGRHQVRRRARPARGGHARSPTRSAGSSCSPARPAPASRPRSRR